MLATKQWSDRCPPAPGPLARDVLQRVTAAKAVLTDSPTLEVHPALSFPTVSGGPRGGGCGKVAAGAGMVGAGAAGERVLPGVCRET